MDACGMEKLAAVQLAVTTALDKADAPLAAMPPVIQAICKSLNWSFGAFWTLEAESKSLNCKYAWSIPSREMKEFAERSRLKTFTVGDGLPGRIATSRQLVWISDTLIEETMPQRTLFRQGGFRCVMGMPVLYRQKTFGVCEFLCHEVRQTNPALGQVMTSLGMQIGHFIQHMQVKDALQAQHGPMHSGLKTTGLTKN
jgi:signal transduction protein with GAF and PtsI domain